MEKSVFTPAYGVLQAKLVAMRRAAGLTQRDLAGRLRREHSFVARIEQGERRVDLVEFYWICVACRTSPEAVLKEVLRGIRAVERKTGQPMSKKE